MKKATLIAALAIIGALAGTTDASAHRGPTTSIVHEIDHVRQETNKIRRTIGRRMYKPDVSYRTVDNRAVSLETLIVWTQRLKKARRLPPHPRSVWARLAECESNGDWSWNGSGLYDGGLQFHPQTWASYRPRRYPEYAWQAKPYQQIRVAKRLQRAAGWGQWPACSLRLGLR